MIAHTPPQPPTTQTTVRVQASQTLSSPARPVVQEAILRAEIRAAINKNNAENIRTGVTLYDLSNGRTVYGHEQDAKHFAASVNKVPVALLVLEDIRAGKLSLDQTVTWQASDVRGGFGDYDQPGAPTQATLRQVMYDILNKSGNTVVRATVNYLLGGPQAVNDRFATKPGLPNTSLTVLTPTTFYLGDSTPRDAMWALQQVTKKQDAPAKFMTEAMQTNIFTDFGVRSQLPANSSLKLTNKIGLLDDPEGNNRHDVGIFYNPATKRYYGYSFFTTSPFESTTATVRADESLKEMGGSVIKWAGGKQTSKSVKPYSHRRLEQRVRL